MNKVQVFRNTDRYTKCGSCRAMATYVLIVPEVEVTVIYPPVAAGHGLKDDVQVRAWSVTTCEKHEKINLKRAQHAEPTTIDHRPTKENRS